MLDHSSRRSRTSDHWARHRTPRSQHLWSHHLTILHRTLWSQLNWNNLLRRLDPVSHRSPYLLWLQWPHYRLRSQHWTSKLLLMLDWLLLVRGSMLLLLLRMLACLRMLTRTLLLWVLLLLL